MLRVRLCALASESGFVACVLATQCDTLLPGCSKTFRAKDHLGLGLFPQQNVQVYIYHGRDS